MSAVSPDVLEQGTAMSSALPVGAPLTKSDSMHMIKSDSTTRLMSEGHDARIGVISTKSICLDALLFITYSTIAVVCVFSIGLFAQAWSMRRAYSSPYV
uniref:Uncharacterized protein n=1 Tax=Haptolina ericina TaxID=156174 RepID=A0A7S3BF17_9EUKA|eukprot:CAMPEP_0181176318 /NCGR_PEP_ID=MMETSP1096-20121128/4564_1 /TAXON_ID=156174 ORGANISM="Chrysochromulina ericina, Strain CCMP281" /NCGR_SAMPLE_ID=MMETSP1096 /ASSEMBLY_ACC=CAM_ASM_000453 /LENGTH=98 /DNA_ID=CAMNT_0023264395 /DNA_START=48 /DNA_END=344 /DNA_ORIENTATION=+